LFTTNKDLNRNTSRYKCLLQSITNYIYTVKVKDGKAFSTSHSQSCEAVTGYSIEDYNSDPQLWYNMIHVDDRQIVLNQVNKLLSGNTVTPIENRLYHKNGEIIWIKQTLVPQFDKYMNIIQYDGLIENITERKRTEEALKQSERKYRHIFENTQDIYYQTLLDGTIVDVSPSILKQTGYSKEELIGKSIELLYRIPESRIDFLRRILDKKEVVDYEVESILKNKDAIVASINAHIIFDANGIPTAIEGSLRNITERKRTEERLKKLNQAVEQSPSSIIITDINGIINYVNPRFSNLTGYKAEEVIGKKARLLKPEKIKPYDFKDVWENITNGKSWRGEFFNRKKNKETFCESVLISPITNDKGEVSNFLIITEDISEKKKFIKELIEAKETAEKSDKLKSEFLEQMSHEIRTPINAVVNFTSLLRDEIEEKNQIFKEYFDAIEDSSKRIIRTMDMILNMSEIQTGNYHYISEQINLNKDVVEKTCTKLRSKAQVKNLVFKIIHPAEDILIHGDRYSLEQIFQHIIENAIIYTSKGMVEVSFFTDEKHNYCVKVADTGIGISKDFLPDLFKPFRQEDQGYTRRYDGNGLGLALVKKYCELNNADISVTSKKNEGSVFTVKFNPLALSADRPKAVLGQLLAACSA